MIETLFIQALGRVARWQVDEVIFKLESGRIDDFQVRFGAAVHACPACGAAAQPLHDRLARVRKSHAGVLAIGVDETASKRGQAYLDVFYHIDAQRLLFATPGRDKATLGKFASDLTEHGGQPAATTHVSMDMSCTFQAGGAEHFPAAEVCLDRFHVVALSSKALDEVRRAVVKSEPELKGTRWGLHKKPANWTVKQVANSVKRTFSAYMFG